MSKKNVIFLLCGMLAGIVGSICLSASLYLFFAAEWLVVNNQPSKADAAVVLGGGGAARLRKAITLYDAHLVNRLVLVDKDEADWRGVMRLCPDGRLDGKNVTILSGSESTWTDGEKALSFCKQKGIHSILVVTDPYHSRRADIIFKHFFRGSNTSFRVVNSGDYGRLVPPGRDWRHDQRTRQVIWMETGKVLALMLPTFILR